MADSIDKRSKPCDDEETPHEHTCDYPPAKKSCFDEDFLDKEKQKQQQTSTSSQSQHDSFIVDIKEETDVQKSSKLSTQSTNALQSSVCLNLIDSKYSPATTVIHELERLKSDAAMLWTTAWGPFLSERLWGTVREDVSMDGNCWEYLRFEESHRVAYHHGEDGLLGVCDGESDLCIALALWNCKDPLFKEKLFGLTNQQGNHGEDVKELYYYLDNVPTHSYMRALYKYPHCEFPYSELVTVNAKRGPSKGEYEILDTGVFDKSSYWDITVEYAKASPHELACSYTVHNHGSEVIELHVLPHVWLRDTGYRNHACSRAVTEHASLSLSTSQEKVVLVSLSEGSPTYHVQFFSLDDGQRPKLSFCHNSSQDLSNKSAFSDHLCKGKSGSKCAADYCLTLAPGGSQSVMFALTMVANPSPELVTKEDCKALFRKRKMESDEYYAWLLPESLSDEQKMVMRQAYAGLLWSKQYYEYDVTYSLQRKAEKRKLLDIISKIASKGELIGEKQAEQINSISSALVTSNTFGANTQVVGEANKTIISSGGKEEVSTHSIQPTMPSANSTQAKTPCNASAGSKCNMDVANKNLFGDPSPRSAETIWSSIRALLSNEASKVMSQTGMTAVNVDVASLNTAIHGLSSSAPAHNVLIDKKAITTDVISMQAKLSNASVAANSKTTSCDATNIINAFSFKLSSAVTSEQTLPSLSPGATIDSVITTTTASTITVSSSLNPCASTMSVITTTTASTITGTSAVRPISLIGCTYNVPILTAANDMSKQQNDLCGKPSLLSSTTSVTAATDAVSIATTSYVDSAATIFGQALQGSMFGKALKPSSTGGTGCVVLGSSSATKTKGRKLAPLVRSSATTKMATSTTTSVFSPGGRLFGQLASEAGGSVFGGSKTPARRNSTSPVIDGFGAQSSPFVQTPYARSEHNQHSISGHTSCVNERNINWKHLRNHDIISVPDKWEFPWHAAWDLAFQMIPFCRLDAEFSRSQLKLLLSDRYMHPNGQLTGCEFEYSDSNPPIHAWACLKVFHMDQSQHTDDFLAPCFHKLISNFDWWLTRQCPHDNFLFTGGFLGLDNISVVDRSHLPNHNWTLYQADAGGWMALFCLNMLQISLQLAHQDKLYIEFVPRFLFWYFSICEVMNRPILQGGLWSPGLNFYFDVLCLSQNNCQPISLYSTVGLVPLFACTTFSLTSSNMSVTQLLKCTESLSLPKGFQSSEHLMISGNNVLLSLIPIPRLHAIFTHLFDPNKFLSPFGIRSLSKEYAKNPYQVFLDGKAYKMNFEPGESSSRMFGGNSNWRGPVWLPINYLIVEALETYHQFLGDEFTVNFPTPSGTPYNLRDIALDICRRVISIFMFDEKGHRPCHGQYSEYDEGSAWSDLLLYHEYFHSETGRGCGASHQTGWTALVTEFILKIHH